MRPTATRVFVVAALTLAWCGLWRDLSAANVLGGLAISGVIMMSGVATSFLAGIRPLPLLRLAWLVAVDLLKSTVSVAYEILTPTDHTEESVVAVDVPESRDHLLLLVVAITLTPGTAVVDADPDTGTLYLHLLHHDRRDETVAHVEKLARLACAALPTARSGVTT